MTCDNADDTSVTQALRLARYIRLGVNPLPMGLDSLDPSFSVLVDMVIQEQDIMESEAIAKIKKQAKGLKGGRK